MKRPTEAIERVLVAIQNDAGRICEYEDQIHAIVDWANHLEAEREPKVEWIRDDTYCYLIVNDKDRGVVGDNGFWCVETVTLKGGCGRAESLESAQRAALAAVKRQDGGE